MRRIDLICKLLAPVFISLVDSLSTKIAIWVVFGVNTVSVLIEYMAIAQVGSAIYLYVLYAHYILTSLPRFIDPYQPCRERLKLYYLKMRTKRRIFNLHKSQLKGPEDIGSRC